MFDTNSLPPARSTTAKLRAFAALCAALSMTLAATAVCGDDGPEEAIEPRV